MRFRYRSRSDRCAPLTRRWQRYRIARTYGNYTRACNPYCERSCGRRTVRCDNHDVFDACLECVDHPELAPTSTLVIGCQKIARETGSIDLIDIQVAVSVHSTDASNGVSTRNRDVELERFVIKGGISSKSGVRGTAARECTRKVGRRARSRCGTY